MQTVTSADGTRIAYEQHGEGPPLILLHGGGTRHFWKPLIPRFADDYTVVVPDRRGRGDSGDNDAYSLEREIEDACAVIETVDGDPILFGHSFGGLEAIEAARVASITQLIAYEPAVLVGAYKAQADLAAQMQAHLDAGERREAMKLHLREVLYGGEEEQFEQWLNEWPAWPKYAGFVENALRMNQVIEQYDLPDKLDVNVPALLLMGTQSPSHLQDSARAVHEALPKSHLLEFDNVGHNGPTEASDRVATEVRSFIENEVLR